MRTKGNSLPRLALLCGVALAFGVVTVLAQAGPAIDWWVIAGGGGPAAGSGVAVNGTLGQPIIGPSAGSSVALGAGYWYGASPPTAVTLASFTATARDGAIVLAWETVNEVDLLGFHLYRAAGAGDLPARLNADLIPGQAPGSQVGGSYEFVDETVAPGVACWYWLEAVNVHGTAMRYGPVSATVQPGEPARIYLPLVRK